jgi:hypothetical protein
MDKRDTELCFFSLNDPELYRFYSDKTGNNFLYYALYIEKYMQEILSVTKEVLHIRENAILLIELYLFPAFYHLHLNGYVIIVSETFYISDKTQTLQELLFFIFNRKVLLI